MLLTAGEISNIYRHSLELVATFDRYQVALRLGSLQSEIVYGVQCISFYLQINSNQPSNRIHSVAKDVAKAQLIRPGEVPEPHDDTIQELDEGEEGEEAGTNIQDQHDGCRRSLEQTAF